MQEPGLSYIEKSRLFRSWFWFLFIPPLIILGVLGVRATIAQDTTGLVLSIFFFLFDLCLLVLAFFHVLTLQIDRQGISLKYFPYFQRPRIYSWSQVKEIEIVRYDPIRDFSGWGLKRSKKYGKGYTTTGDLGLAVTLKNGDKFLITVINIEQTRTALKSFKE